MNGRVFEEDTIARISLLYDCYGQLLSSRQREVMALYHEENLSLAEIAEELGISRQGVHDTLKKGEAGLADYEEKLGLVERLMKTKKILESVRAELFALENGCKDRENPETTNRIERISGLLSSLEL